jgi:hypothetical protein
MYHADLSQRHELEGQVLERDTTRKVAFTFRMRHDRGPLSIAHSVPEISRSDRMKGLPEIANTPLFLQLRKPYPISYFLSFL